MEKIYTITFSPAIDYFVCCNTFEVGKFNRADSVETLAPGGKGINVSVMLKNLGVSSTALGFTAGFTGEAIENMTKALGVDTDFIRVNGMSRINVKVRSGSRETELNGQGPMVDFPDMEKLLEKLDALEDDDWLILAGSVPKSMPAGIYATILNRVKSKEIKIIADTADDWLKSVLPYKPYLIKPNVDELSRFFATKTDSKATISRLAKRLQEMGARNVIVSMGEKGAYLLDEENEEYWISAPKGKMVNTIGSGDSLVAGFVAGCLQYGNLYRHALRLGVAAGSASAFTQGLASKAEVEALLREMD